MSTPDATAWPPVATADYRDRFETATSGRHRSALDVALATFARTPRWVRLAMSARNRVVSPLGLKDLGALDAIDPARPPESYRPGDRLGIFTIVSLSEREIVLGDRDRHLDVQVTISLPAERPGIVSTSTAVHMHNLLGRVYMFFVVPMHRRIVPAMMARLPS